MERSFDEKEQDTYGSPTIGLLSHGHVIYLQGHRKLHNNNNTEIQIQMKDHVSSVVSTILITLQTGHSCTRFPRLPFAALNSSRAALVHFPACRPHDGVLL